MTATYRCSAFTSSGKKQRFHTFFKLFRCQNSQAITRQFPNKFAKCYNSKTNVRKRGNKNKLVMLNNKTKTEKIYHYFNLVICQIWAQSSISISSGVTYLSCVLSFLSLPDDRIRNANVQLRCTIIKYFAIVCGTPTDMSRIAWMLQLIIYVRVE